MIFIQKGMAKYKIKDNQLVRLYEVLKKDIKERDNYAPGSDTKDAPWNDSEPKRRPGKVISGHIRFIASDNGEYLFSDDDTHNRIYTYEDIFMDGDSNIHAFLEDYLDIPEETYQDDDGETRKGYMDNWIDHINADDIGKGLASYLNHMKNEADELSMTDDEMKYLSGNYQFFLITPNTNNHVLSDIIASEKLQNTFN